MLVPNTSVYKGDFTGVEEKDDTVITELIPTSKPGELPTDPSEWPSYGLTPFISATEVENNQIRVAVSLTGESYAYDVGIMYDPSQVRYVGFTRTNKQLPGWFVTDGCNDKHNYALAAGVGADTCKFADEEIGYFTFVIIDRTKDITFNVCMDSAIYNKYLLSDIENKPLSDVAPIQASCTVKMQEPITKTEEQIINPDGSETNKVKETATDADGTVTEMITEKTVQTDGTVTEKMTKTVTHKDGSAVSKTIEEISISDAQGNVTKEITVTDVKKNAEGTITEKYEYTAENLSSDVEWYITVVEKANMTDADKKAIEAMGVKDYITYDIVPMLQGKEIEVSEERVKVSLYCGNKWIGKKVKVFDFENNCWLDAVTEGEYVTFYASHFSKYAIAEVTDVMKGDVDQNGQVELADAQKTLKAALKIDILEGDAITAADVDENGTVELADAQQVLKYALKIISEFDVK